MGGSTEPPVGLVSVDDQGPIMAILDIQRYTIGFEELNDGFAHTPAVVMGVVQYTQPIRDEQMVFNHPQLIIDQQRQITGLLTKQFLPPQCDQTWLEQQKTGSDEGTGRGLEPTCSTRNR